MTCEKLIVDIFFFLNKIEIVCMYSLFSDFNDFFGYGLASLIFSKILDKSCEVKNCYVVVNI